MKRLLTYLTMPLLALSASANTGSEVIGGEPVVSADWEVQVYPNPSNGVCNILVNGNNSKLNVLVFNVIGEKMFETKILGEHQAKLDLTGLETGLYIVQVVDEARSKIRTMRMQIE